MKSERERRIQDYHRALEKEKDTYRARLAEAETKAKDAERTRGLQNFELEKERARWQLEKDGYLCKVNELEDTVEKLVGQKETLMKDNVKMSAQVKRPSTATR